MQARENFRRLKNFAADFLALSTFHGFGHLAADRSRHVLETVIWFSLIALAIYGAAVLSALTLTRYRENPTVISMERDRFSWNTSFPSATICPTTKLDEALLEEYLDKSQEVNRTLLREFLERLAEATYETFHLVPSYEGIRPDDYLNLILNLSFTFKPSVSNSGINSNQYSLQKILTEMGICYSFNSQLAVYNSPEYWAGNRWELIEGNETFFVNPLDGEVFANVINMSTGFNIYLHGPYEVADVASKVLNSPKGYFLQIYLNALTLYSSERARSLRIGQRKCRFFDESDLRHSPAYSYVLCRIECRIALARKLCGCLPHFYRRLDNERVCDVKGMQCLAQHRERLITLKKECPCLPNCEDVNYVVENLDTRQWFLGSNLQWGLKEYPRMRLKRDILFGFTDVLVYIGSMAGLFLGCSVLSFIEIIYFFTLRVAVNVSVKRRRNAATPPTLINHRE